jgi:hypothetical protein
MATMFMVVEMTGGYGLIVPAMLSVTLSFAIQSRLTRRARWPSLYQAQVASLGDSPVHHSEYVHKVVDLIHAGRARMPREATPVRLEQLLMMGRPIPVEGTGRSMVLMVVRKGAPAAGVPLKDRPFGPGVSLITILRNESPITPGPNVAVKEGDRLIVLARAEEFERLSNSLEMVGPAG